MNQKARMTRRKQILNRLDELSNLRQEQMDYFPECLCEEDLPITPDGIMIKTEWNRLISELNELQHDNP